jgi:hypothetical protein
MSYVRTAGFHLSDASSRRGSASPRPSRLRGLLPRVMVAAMIAAVVAPWAAVTASAATIDPLACTGYPQKRVFLESQSWWFRTPGKTGTDRGHVHIGTCFPHAQKVSGVVRFDVRVILHHNPGTLTHINIGIAGEWGSVRSVALTPDWRCAETTCTRWFTTYVDTRKALRDGRQEFRFRAQVKGPDSKEMVASTGWLAYVQNGRPIQHYRSSWSAEARGWYTNTGYANAKIESLPMAAIHGLWRPAVRMTAGSGGIPVTSYRAVLDPDFHAGKAGVTIRSGAGSFKGTLKIDTTRMSNGKHRLVLIADANASTGSTNRGLLVVPFVVRN